MSAEYGQWIVEADESGFEFDNICAGTYAVQAIDTFGYRDTFCMPDSQPDSEPSFLLGEKEFKRANIRMESARPYRRIRGRVLNEQGQPITDDNLEAAAWVQKSQGPRKGDYDALCTTRVEPDGFYTLGEIDGRPVYVQVREGGPPVEDDPYPPRFHPGTFSRSEARLVTFGDANSVEGVDVRMRKTGGRVLEGVVTDKSTGAPVAQALVAIFHADMWF